MIRWIACAALVAAAIGVGAQGEAQADPAAKNKEAIKKLDFLVGEWRGEGWSQMGPGGRQNATIREVIQYKLDGTILLVEGRGTAMVEGQERVVHGALGVVSFDPSTGKYQMKPWLANGQTTDAWIEVLDKGFDWGFDIPGGHGKTRYKMRINEKGQWNEKGEFSPDGGKTWHPFFEMTLDKVKS